MLLTVPVVKEVVTVVNKADCGTPKRTSFPSILPGSGLCPSPESLDYLPFLIGNK